MDANQVMAKVNEIFIDVLDTDDIVLMRETTANDVEDWDSLTHIQLIVAIEKSFKLKFTTAEIHKWTNVGEMCDAIAQKIA